ncbi:beta-glucosidase [Sodiomyces alkalinus F11]|uniref:Beta-glucosidase cel3A n=1 Tax=Sodiomyces alkalinus (strain CBS 110278 / VKM F-3762 / F11) TaxID=1314773 RepID=A0A3N2Q430_SODAK|nr:beta-glucosidase [Sodiomyces alkalinus F11]ROT41385.1 beta-glucosidase [Sodiomyces alkalinus F11]
MSKTDVSADTGTAEHHKPTMSEQKKPSVWQRVQAGLPFLKTKKRIIIVLVVLVVIIGGGLAGLAALPSKKTEGSVDREPMTDDSFFYGLSPPVYPSPEMEGLGAWSDAFEKARDMVGEMTLEEKVSLTGGIRSSTGCAGLLPPIRRLRFPGMCLHDAGQGLRNTDFVNAYPAGIHVGASWNKPLARRRAKAMGSEFRTKGVNVLLGPSIGPMGRVVSGGRNWESFSVDPYLTGVFVHETVNGVQEEGVLTSVKHFIANEQETNRLQKLPREAVSSNVDDKTMHEFYLWPFQDAVHAGSANIMCSYQRINNSYGCQNSKTMNGLLKDELGFQGWVVSDWDAQHAGVAAALAGMDVAMPVPHDYWGDTLVEAVRNGSVPESRVTDMVTRVIASWYRLNQDHEDFPPPGAGMPMNVQEPHAIVDARNTSSRGVLRDGAVEGHVLVKNANGALPLGRPRLLSLFGYSATSARGMNFIGGGFVDPLAFGAYPVGWEEVEAGFTMKEDYDQDWSAIGLGGTMISGGGSGAPSPSTLISPFEAIKAQADGDGTALLWDFERGDPGVHAESDACLVFGNVWASESYDRPALYDDYTDGLILNVASRCNNTMVVLHNAGPRLVDQWIEHSNVTAVLFAHLPGQDSGNALVSILYGGANPSGKLPYTVARNESDYAHLAGPDVLLPDDRVHANFPQSNFSEGVYVDYRHFDRQGIEPRFAFGFGLSYTSFAFGNLTVQASRNASTTAPYPTGPLGEGGPQDLWAVLARVSADVRNTGAVAGHEVAQLYVGIPGGPVRQLRGFDKPFVEAGESAAVEFELTRRDLSVWDVGAQKWHLQNGTYGVWVGSSSRDLPLEGEFAIQN